MKYLVTTFLAFGIFVSPVLAAEQLDQTDETTKETRIEFLEKEVEALKNEMDKRADQSEPNGFADSSEFKSDQKNVMNIIERQDKRIEDISKNIDFFAMLISAIGLVITLLVVFFSIRVSNEAKAEARNEARKEVKDMKDEIQQEAEEIKTELKDEAKLLIEVIKKTAEEAKNKKDEIDNLFNEKSRGNILSSSPENDEKLTEKVKKTQEKYEENLTFMDWSTKAMQQLDEKNYEKAIDFLNKATVSSGSSDLQIAVSRIVKGIAHEHLGMTDEAINEYNEVIQRFGESQDEEILVWVAAALVKKGIAHEHLGMTDEAINEYNEVIQRFGESQDEEMRSSIATALLLKGINKGKNLNIDEALRIFNEIIKRFGDSQDEEILVVVASALVNKGIALKKMGHLDEAIGIFGSVIKRFRESQNEDMLRRISNAITNKFESILLSNKSFEKKEKELYLKINKKNSRALMDLEMLEILENSLTISQEQHLKIWLKKYRDIPLDNWSFDELDKWAEEKQNLTVKLRLKDTLKIFKDHQKRFEQK